jgi:chromosome segregation and condensation protein ScpB
MTPRLAKETDPAPSALTLENLAKGCTSPLHHANAGRKSLMAEETAGDDTAHDAPLTDEALAVFAFAAYHQLESGEPVTRVVINDGAGHRADGKAVAELTERGLAEVENDRIAFTDSGEALLARIVETIRKTGS